MQTFVLLNILIIPLVCYFHDLELVNMTLVTQTFERIEVRWKCPIFVGVRNLELNGNYGVALIRFSKLIFPIHTE